LAVGIGATTSVFSVADALLLRPLQLHEPDRLVRVHATEPDLDEWNNVASGPTYLEWRDQSRSFDGMAAFRSISFNLLGDGYPQRIPGVSVTSDFFEVLGVDAALGRTPRTDDEVGEGRTVVLAHSLWRARFGSDPQILGQTLVLNGLPTTVVGVMPPEFTFPAEAEIYVTSPFRVPETPGSTVDMSDDPGAQYLSVVARLSEGVGVAAAQSEMDAISAEIERTYPDANRGEGASVVLLKDDLVGDTRATLMVLLGAVGFVMLIACANVANLLTVRASRRSRELSVRMALGAGLSRLRRQLLTESVLLSILGAVPGLLLAAWGTRALVALAPDSIPRLDEITLDARVFAFSAVLALATGLLFGLAPAVGLSDRRSGLSYRLHGNRTVEGQRSRLRDVVVVAEVALSLLLLVGAGLMVRTFQGLQGTDPGFDGRRTLVAHVSLPLSHYAEDEESAAFYDEALVGIRALPGVESAATVLTLPMHWAIRGTFGMSIEGRPDDQSDDIFAGYQVVSPDYFHTLRIPLLRGRVITDTDVPESGMVAVINEALSRRYWPNEDPVGRRLTFWGGPEDPETEWATIVGVVGNAALEGLDHPPVGEVFLAQSQVSMNRTTFVVRGAEDPYDMAPAVREVIRQIDPTLPLYGVSSMEDVVADSLAQRRFRMFLLGIFAGTALVMAAVGLYGVLSFSVAQRAREIGIRKALGAPSGGVVLRVVAQGYSRVALGLVIGLLASFGMSRFIASQVYGVSATDALTYVASASLLASVALFACWIPAARAARVDPLETIRSE
jgi:putative ABC transport system permease protein